MFIEDMRDMPHPPTAKHTISGMPFRPAEEVQEYQREDKLTVSEEQHKQNFSLQDTFFFAMHFLSPWTSGHHTTIRQSDHPIPLSALKPKPSTLPLSHHHDDRHFSQFAM